MFLTEGGKSYKNGNIFGERRKKRVYQKSKKVLCISGIQKIYKKSHSDLFCSFPERNIYLSVRITINYSYFQSNLYIMSHQISVVENPVAEIFDILSLLCLNITIHCLSYFCIIGIDLNQNTLAYNNLKLTQTRSQMPQNSAS